MNETTKKNDSRGRLVRSMLVLLLCLIMFVASTWAWFTDSASNTGNKITAGNLKVALLQRKSDDTFEYEDISNKEASIFTTGGNANETNATLWEPGATHIAYLAVQNKGSLALQYNIYLDVTDNGLASALEYAIIPQGRKYDPNLGCTGTIDSWTDAKAQATAASATNYGSLAAGSQRYTVAQNGCLNAIADKKENTNETEYFAVAIHMKEDAGNDYQSKDITIDVHVAATQKAAEKDSYTTEYDKNATLPIIPKNINETKSQTVSTAGQSVTIGDNSTESGISVVKAASETGNIQIKTSAKTTDQSSIKTNYAMAADSKLDRQFKTVASTADSVTYDISYVYTEGDTSYDVSEFAGVVTNTINVGTGLKGVTVTHSHGGTSTEMTGVTGTGDANYGKDGYFYYDSTTGYLTIWSSKYSSFEIGYATEYAASIGTQGYATLEDAIEAVNDGETIALQKDLTYTAALVISNGKAFTLDLSGYTFTGRFNLSNVKLTLKNGTFKSGEKGSDTQVALNLYGTNNSSYNTNDNLFTYLKIEEDVTVSGVYGVYLREQIDNVYGYGEKGSDSFGVKVDCYGKVKASTPVFLGGNVGATNDGRHCTEGTMYDGQSAPTFNLYGTLETTTEKAEDSSQGISMNGACVVNVYDGASVTGSEAIGVKAGFLNVYGGELTATGAKVDPVQAVNSGTEASGGAISVSSYYSAGHGMMKVNVSGGTIISKNNAALLVTHSYSNGSAIAFSKGVEVSVTGGTFKGGEDKAVWVADKIVGDLDSYPAKFISGGTFNSNPINYLKAGYETKQTLIEQILGDWTVSKIPTADYTKDDQAKTVSIDNAKQLAKFAEDVNSGTSFAGYTVTLTDDIDLEDIAWVPINAGNWGMTFDGNGKTIENLNVYGEKNVGLFGTFTGNTMKDLTVDSATVSGINHVAALSGDGLCAHFDNCTVKNARITTSVKNNDDGDKAGAITGYLSAEPTASVKNCKVEDCTIEGYRDVGSVVGYANGASVVTGNTASNVTLINNRNYSVKAYTTSSEFDVNDIVGEAVSAATVNNNTGTNIKKSILVQTGTDAAATKSYIVDAINYVGNGGTVILPTVAYEIDLKGTTLTANGVTVKGNKAITLKVSTDGNSPSVSADGVIFDSVKFDYGNQTYNAIRGNLTFKNCTFSGLVNNYDTSTFTNCTFTNTSNCYQAHIYGGEATFTGCTFDGSNRNVYVYTETGDAKATFENCTFNMTETDKSCVMLNANNGDGAYTVVIKNCTASDKANNQGTQSSDGPRYDYKGIYGIKNKDGNGNNKNVKGTVTLDGTKVFEQ